MNGKSLTIYSINIFPEFEGRGYARETIEMFKTTFDTIIADRVRPTAIDFGRKWVLMMTTMGIMFGKVDNNNSWLKLSLGFRAI